MNAIVVREMSPDDVQAITVIEKASYTMPWSETSFLSEVYSRHSITRIAELKDKIIAYICIKQVSDEAHLLNLTVDSAYRRQGIATMLFNNVRNDLRENGCRFLYLEVRASNIAANKMYEKLNFRIVGTRKDYYLNPRENALVMMLDLSEKS
ncbi:MAG: ribosomal protein S18-alanine N-acetyltransferase [Nitrospirae bacterium]|nr:ribosomal protein S18-alanine N-acetyltransferase [Nitrospirota bacterium]